MKFKKFISLPIIAFKQKKISAFDFCLFLRQFATLFAAGVPIVSCLETLEKASVQPALCMIIQRIRIDLSSGNSLAYAVNKYPTLFDAFTCGLIRIGEYTGKLDLMLNLIATQQEKSYLLKKRIIHALIYPSIICVTALMITFGLFLFVIPKFSELFQEGNEQLPIFTMLIFWLSAQLKAGLFYYCVLLTVCSLGFSVLLTNTKLRIQIKELVGKLPIFQRYYHKLLLAAFVRNLAICLSAGIQIVEALQLIKPHHHTQMSTSVRHLRNRVNTGLHLHEALAYDPQFPHLMIQMVKIGEESGKLDSMLYKVAEFMEFEIDQLLGRLTQILEPLIMLLLGVLIGGLVIGMYLPIFKLGSTF